MKPQTSADSAHRVRSTLNIHTAHVEALEKTAGMDTSQYWLFMFEGNANVNSVTLTLNVYSRNSGENWKVSPEILVLSRSNSGSEVLAKQSTHKHVGELNSPTSVIPINFLCAFSGLNQSCSSSRRGSERESSHCRDSFNRGGKGGKPPGETDNKQSCRWSCIVKECLTMKISKWSMSQYMHTGRDVHH